MLYFWMLARKGLAITVTDAPTLVEIDTLKRTGAGCGWILELYHEGLVDQHQGE